MTACKMEKAVILAVEDFIIITYGCARWEETPLEPFPLRIQFAFFAQSAVVTVRPTVVRQNLNMKLLTVQAWHVTNVMVSLE